MTTSAREETVVVDRTSEIFSRKSALTYASLHLHPVERQDPVAWSGQQKSTMISLIDIRLLECKSLMECEVNLRKFSNPDSPAPVMRFVHLRLHIMRDFTAVESTHQPYRNNALVCRMNKWCVLERRAEAVLGPSCVKMGAVSATAAAGVSGIMEGQANIDLKARIGGFAEGGCPSVACVGEQFRIGWFKAEWMVAAVLSPAVRAISLCSTGSLAPGPEVFAGLALRVLVGVTKIGHRRSNGMGAKLDPIRRRTTCRRHDQVDVPS